MFADDTVRQFVERAAARTPTPGGGSVAALTGALGSALGTMGARYSLGKEPVKDPKKEAEVKALVESLDGFARSFLFLVDEDAAAYDRVTVARRLPKETMEQREKRKVAVEKAFAGAVEVPMKTVRLTLELIESIYKLAPHANPNLVTDVAVGAILAEAAFEGARLNVLVNLPGVSDPSFRSRTLADLEEVRRIISARKESILGQVEQALSE